MRLHSTSDSGFLREFDVKKESSERRWTEKCHHPWRFLFLDLYIVSGHQWGSHVGHLVSGQSSMCNWPASDSTNDLILLTASFLELLASIQLKLYHPNRSGGPVLRYPDRPSVDSQICGSVPLLWLWSQLPFAIALDYVASEQAMHTWQHWDQPILMWQFLHSTTQLGSPRTCMKPGLLSPGNLEIECSTVMPG